MTEKQGITIKTESFGIIIGREDMGVNSNVFNPTFPVEDVDIYWVWGDGEWILWADEDEIEI